MAISSSTRKAGPFIGNDATTVFPFAFKVFTSADLRVVRTNALGVESDLVLDTDYTVALNANQDNDPGGTVTRATALPTGERLTITSDVEALQPLVLTNNGGFYPRVINDAFDKITIIAQQLIEQVGRSLKLPISSTASATLPDPVANRLIAWNSSANGFTNVNPASLATVAAYADANLELFTGNGTQTAFTLAQDPAVLANLDVSISGVTQVGGEDFTWVGTTLTFVVAPPNGTRIQVRYTRAIPPADLAGAVAAAEADRVATAADRVQTGLDRIATAADAEATAADVVSAEADRVATAADRVQTGLDRVQTGLDRAQTGADVVSAAAILSSSQPLDADLTAIAALASAADKLPYATGAQAWALTDLTEAGRALLDDVSATAQRTTLGFYSTVAALLASTVSLGSAGDIIEAAGHRYQIVTTGEHLTTAGGVKLIVIPEVAGYDVRAFGVTADGVTNDRAALNAALNVAITDRKAALLPDALMICASSLSFPDAACSLQILGSGKYKSFTGGASGDPFLDQGSTIKFTGASGTLFPWTLTGSNKRVNLTLENLTLQGNLSASSGHCVHLQTSSATNGFLVNYQNVVVREAKQHGIFHDGNVFECNFFDVRVNFCGGSGVKLAINGAGLCGETRFFAGYYAFNDIGLDLGGGGHNSIHGVSCSYNNTHDLKNDGADLEVFEIHCEGGPTVPLASERILIKNCNAPAFFGVLLTVQTGHTGVGMKFESVLTPYVNKLRTNSSVAGAGYKDIKFDNGCSRGELRNYWPDDFVFRYDFGAIGGHLFQNGAARYTGVGNPRQSFTVTSTASIQPDARSAEGFYVLFTGGLGCTVDNPFTEAAYFDGQTIRFTFKNSTGGALSSGITFGSAYLGGITAPADTKVRTIAFEYVEALAKWVKLSESADL